MKNSVKTGSPRNIKYNIIVSFLFKRKPFHSFETAFYMDVCEGKNCNRKGWVFLWSRDKNTKTFYLLKT